MTSNPVSYFVNALGMTEDQMVAFITHAVAANLKTAGIMDNFGLAVRLKNALPDCIVVHRDSNFEPSPGAHAVQSLLDLLDGIESKDKRIVIAVNCEYGWDADRVNMWCDMIEAAAKVGWNLCVGNTSCGSIKCGQGNDKNDWLTTGARLLKVLMDNPGNYFGAHNYTGPFLWLVANGGWGDPKSPPDKIDWTKPQWHLGREVQGIIAACKALGYEKLLERQFIIITEGLFDQMNDTALNPDNPYHTILSNRWRWLVNKWAEWYPGKDAQDVLADQSIWAWEKIYAVSGIVVGIHMFTWLDAGGQWQEDRIDNAPIYLKRMEHYRSVAAPPPAVIPPAPAPVTPPPDDATERINLQIKLVQIQKARVVLNQLLDEAESSLQKLLTPAA